jgi:zinc/manganese transport system permease protein
VSAELAAVFAPGFFSSSPVHVALVAGGAVAVVSAVVGVFTVVRGQSFAGHALADVGSTGGSAAFLIGMSPLWGFLLAGLAGSGAIELLGFRRTRGRDVATGIVLGGALGVSALLLYLDSTHESTTGATMTVLFGSMFAIDSSLVPAFIALSAVALVVVGAIYRPLLLASIEPDLARARGVPVRLVGIFYLLALSIAVAMSCMTIGAILSTALLVGPPATALRLTKRPGAAMAIAPLTGLVATLAGIVLAYDSYSWPPAGRGWPVSFFIVAIVFVGYLLAGLSPSSRRRRRVF